MVKEEFSDSLQTLQDIRSIMERSGKFISLSGWSGIWAGTVGLAGSFIAYRWLQVLPGYYSPGTAISMSDEAYDTTLTKFVLLAAVVLIVALIGGYYFTWRKTKAQGETLWNSASRRMLWHMAVPLTVGGIFALNFLYEHHAGYIAPTCLAFYGLALINGSKYTLSDIRYLGFCEVALGCVSLFMPGYGLTFWTIGFGALHILYGVIMWNKYDKQLTKQAE